MDVCKSILEVRQLRRCLVMNLWIVISLLLSVFSHFIYAESLSVREKPSLTLQEHPHLKIDSAYIRAMPPGQKTTAAYMSIVNSSSDDYFLNEVRADFAKKIELHENRTSSDGVISMVRRKQFKIPAGQRLDLVPGAQHLMIFGFDKTVIPGATLKMHLILGNGHLVEVSVPVQKEQ